MSVFEILLVGVGLSMDAFAVSVCKGLLLERGDWKKALAAGAWFGGFQALMPSLGYLLGASFSRYIEAVDHWIAFALLAFIGVKMILDSFHEEKTEAGFSARVMLPLAVATSIDALAVGVSFSFLRVRIIPAALLIGATTFLFGFAGVLLGRLAGLRLKKGAEILGGAILVLIGLRILLEGLGVF